MNRSDFLKALISLPAAIGLAKAAEAKVEPVVPPSVKRTPREIADALRANKHFIPQLSAGLASTGVYYIGSPFAHIAPEDCWPNGSYGCCMHRGKGACDLCRRPGADPEADERMRERFRRQSKALESRKK